MLCWEIAWKLLETIFSAQVKVHEGQKGMLILDYIFLYFEV